jgi:cytidyltransferase-like protein
MKLKTYKTGLAHGVFDFIHVGHIEHFREAKKYCAKLVVSVTVDKYVNKGPNRPAFSLNERVNLLKSIIYIDQVIISNHETAIQSIKKIKPDVYFKGLDYDKIDTKNKNNLNKQIQELEKFGGKFIITKTKLRSSSKILNENFNFIKDDVKKFLETINKKELLNKLKKILFKKKKYKKNQNILLTGEQILDYYTNVDLQGKSQKSSVISAVKNKTHKYGGGSILVANLLSEFVDSLYYLVNGNLKTKKKLSVYLDHINKINLIMTGDKVEKLLIKERFIENYSKARLFQLNQNQKYFNLNKNNKKFQKTFLDKIKEFTNVIIFDYGYGFIDERFSNIIKNENNKFYINCQTNSSNYGFNLFSKYKKAEILCVDEMEFRLTVKNKEDEIFDLIKKNHKSLKNYKTFIVTCGSKGCYVLNSKKIEYIPTIFETTLDTTGCGDIFFSTFVYFYIQNKLSLKEISFFSHIAAGIHGLTEGNKNKVNKNYFFQTAQTLLK